MNTRVVLMRGILILAALAGGLLLFLAVVYMFEEAPRLARARDDPYFVGAAQLIAVGGFESGFILGAALATGFSRRSLWSALRIATIVAWLFFPLNAWFTFTLF